MAAELKTWQKLLLILFCVGMVMLGARELYRSSPRTDKIDAEQYIKDIFGSRGTNDEKVSEEKNNFSLIKRLFKKYKEED